MTVQIPHLAVPLMVDAGTSAFTVNEQDSFEDVATCIECVLKTPAGSRAELPAFGVPILPFQQPIPLAAVASMLFQWEPRAAAYLTVNHRSDDPMVVDMETALRRNQTA